MRTIIHSFAHRKEEGAQHTPTYHACGRPSLGAAFSHGDSIIFSCVRVDPYRYCQTEFVIACDAPPPTAASSALRSATDSAFEKGGFWHRSVTALPALRAASATALPTLRAAPATALPALRAALIRRSLGVAGDVCDIETRTWTKCFRDVPQQHAGWNS